MEIIMVCLIVLYNIGGRGQHPITSTRPMAIIGVVSALMDRPTIAMATIFLGLRQLGLCKSIKQ